MHAVASLGSPDEWRMVPTAANGQPAAAPTGAGPTAPTGRSGSWCSPPPPRASPVSWCSGTRDCSAGSGSRRPGGERVDDAPRVTEMRLVVTARTTRRRCGSTATCSGLPERAAYTSPGGRVTILEAGRATPGAAPIPAHAEPTSTRSRSAAASPGTSASRSRSPTRPPRHERRSPRPAPRSSPSRPARRGHSLNCPSRRPRRPAADPVHRRSGLDLFRGAETAGRSVESLWTAGPARRVPIACTWP